MDFRMSGHPFMNARTLEVIMRMKVSPNTETTANIFFR